MLLASADRGHDLINRQPTTLLQRLNAALAESTAPVEPQALLRALVAGRLDRLPLPGSASTLERWQALAAVAAHDLSLAKLYEGHTDALAILAELEHPAADSETHADRPVYGVWAAEAPGARVQIAPAGQPHLVTLTGQKSWCSGAAHVTHGLLTAWDRDAPSAGPQLVRVAMRQDAVRCNADAWRAVGMRDSASIDVFFEGALAERVGNVGDYLRRPGFWQGGAGIAACWFGGAQALATFLHSALRRPSASGHSPFRLAALGRIDIALQGTAAILREAAPWIAAHPRADARTVALRSRMSAEATSRLVLDEVGRALGAAPFCRDARFAQLAADLPVFIRQTHAEADLAALGEGVISAQEPPWML